MALKERVRIKWVDQTKGIGIFLVVLGHTLRGLVSGRILLDGPIFHQVDSWIYSFHMPLFFLLSGLFAERRVDRPAGEFVREKLATLAYPYLVWSAIQTLLQAAMSRHTNSKIDITELTWILVEPIMQFWFLYALFLISLFYYLVRRLGAGPLGTLTAFAVFWSTSGWIDFGAWWPINASRKFGIYYVIGSVLDRHGWTERIERARSSLMVMVVVIGFGIVSVWTSQPREEFLPINLMIALSGIAASVALACLLGRIGGTDFIRVIGSHSLEIYVAHTIVSGGLRIVLYKLCKIEDIAIHIVVGTVGGIVFPVLLSWFSRRYHANFLFRFPEFNRSRDR